MRSLSDYIAEPPFGRAGDTFTYASQICNRLRWLGGASLGSSALLLESGSTLLLEDASRLMLEAGNG